MPPRQRLGTGTLEGAAPDNEPKAADKADEADTEEESKPDKPKQPKKK
jgi:hypothetical protein